MLINQNRPARPLTATRPSADVAKKDNVTAKTAETEPVEPANPFAEFFSAIGEALFGKRVSDAGNDGKKVEVTSSNPEASDKTSVLFVGGAVTDFTAAQDESKYLADHLGRDVTLIHNATAMEKVEGGLFGPLLGIGAAADGLQKDLQQVIDDFRDDGTNQAVVELKKEIATRLMRGQDVDLMGVSQGNQIVARALRELHKEPGMDKLMDRIHVVNVMGPVREEDYPPGIRYDHVQMDTDPVTQLLGENVPDNQLGDREENYERRVEQLTGRIFSGGWPGHDTRMILGDLGAPLEEHQKTNLEKIFQVFS